jgi:hypothetical protein
MNYDIPNVLYQSGVPILNVDGHLDLDLPYLAMHAGN